MMLSSPMKGGMMSISLDVIKLDFKSSFTADSYMIGGNYLTYMRFCSSFEAGGSNFYLLGLS